MGINGTAISKEAADMVWWFLLHFDCVKDGRVIW
jgi:hypothetical protein